MFESVINCGAEVLSLAYRASVNIHTNTANPSPSTNTLTEDVFNLTNDTEWFSSKAQSSLPSPVTTAASSRPDANDVLQTEYNNHHKLLQIKNTFHQMHHLKNTINTIWQLIKAISQKISTTYAYCLFYSVKLDMDIFHI